MFHEIGLWARAESSKRQPSRARYKCGRECRMRVFFNLERARPVVLLSIPEPMKQTEAWIAGPGKDELAGTAHPDHLVVNNVGAQADEREIPALLPNDFMARGERDQMTESFKRYTIPIMDEFGDGVSKTCYFTHTALEANRLPVR